MEMKIAYKGGKKFMATSRGHQMIIDLPLEQEGNDSGMTPPEVFIAALGSCVGVYVVNYCKNTKINTNDMLISIDWEKSVNPARISNINITITLPKSLDKDRHAALIKVAEHCLVHNTIQNPPDVKIVLASAELQ